MSKKKKKGKTIERVTHFYGTTHGNVSSINFVYDQATDSFTFEEIDKNTAKVVTSYTSETGKERIINSVPCYDGLASISPTKDLISKYDTIFGIDTNSTVFKGKKISIASVYIVEKNGTQLPMNHFCSFCIVNTKEGINPEAIAWYIFFDILFGDYKNKTIALVTDSDRARHEAINKGQECYYKNYTMPSYARLVYGSSDNNKKNDGLPNALVYLCDLTAKQIITHFKEIDFNIPSTSNGDDNFEGYFMIKGKENGNVKTIEFNFS